MSGQASAGTGMDTAAERNGSRRRTSWPASHANANANASAMPRSRLLHVDDGEQACPALPRPWPWPGVRVRPNRKDTTRREERVTWLPVRACARPPTPTTVTLTAPSIHTLLPPLLLPPPPYRCHPRRTCPALPPSHTSSPSLSLSKRRPAVCSLSLSLFLCVKCLRSAQSPTSPISRTPQ